jgi:predicted ArsR family transcriptional regulator
MMTNNISTRQSEILDLLLNQRSGLSIDEIAGELEISRNAVQQHFASLEKNDYITTADLKKTAGRPVRTYILSENGMKTFPKQYAWFSEIVLTDLKEEMGSEAFASYMKKLGTSLSQQLSSQSEGKSTQERVTALINVMQGLGFQASSSKEKIEDEYTIKACNCIYHDLARKHPEVCEFDKALISNLLDKETELTDCMAKGGLICSFKTK